MATSKAETGSTGLDTVKLMLAVLALAVGIVGFYYFSELSNLYRVLGLLAAVGVAVAFFSATARGKNLFSYLKGARIEVRKMVWPTRQEALQTTLIVMVLVFVVGIFLWLVDMLLGWGVGRLMGAA